jgi:hypothetical protein
MTTTENPIKEDITVVPATAMRSVAHLLAWLDATDRKFIVFKADDLVKGFPDPDAGVAFLQQAIGMYRDFRSTQPTGEIEKNALVDSDGARRDIPIMKGESLGLEELNELVAWAFRQKAKILKKNEGKTLVKKEG